MSEIAKPSPNVMAEVLRRIPSALNDEMPKDLNDLDAEKYKRESRVQRLGKTIADLLDQMGIEAERRTKPSMGTDRRVLDEEVFGWTVLDPEDVGVNSGSGVFLAKSGDIHRLWRAGYESWTSTFMHDCAEGSSEAQWVLESEQFQYGVARLIAKAQQGDEAAAVTQAAALKET